MDIIPFLTANFEDTRKRTVDGVKDCTDGQLCWRPHPEANPIGFLLWHIFRVEDMWINRFTLQRPEVWQAHRWFEKFHMPEQDTGFSYTLEQMASFEIPPLADLLAYQQEVREHTLAYLKGLKPAQLDSVPRADRPEMSIGAILMRLLTHEAHHQGVIMYLRGIEPKLGRK